MGTAKRNRMACPKTQPLAQLQGGAAGTYGAADRRPARAGSFTKSEKKNGGFKNFIMRGDVIIVAVGLVIALAFSCFIRIHQRHHQPVRGAAEGRKIFGLGIHVGDRNAKTFVNIGPFISEIINFVIFMAVIYFIIVVPYKAIQARRGQTVFGDPAPVKTCPACLSSDLPAAATKCRYCGTDQPATAASTGLSRRPP